MALLHMLITPLNAFPWILNGVTEAWVSVKRIQRLIEVNNFNIYCVVKCFKFLKK